MTVQLKTSGHFPSRFLFLSLQHLLSLWLHYCSSPNAPGQSLFHFQRHILTTGAAPCQAGKHSFRTRASDTRFLNSPPRTAEGVCMVLKSEEGGDGMKKKEDEWGKLAGRENVGWVTQPLSLSLFWRGSKGRKSLTVFVAVDPDALVLPQDLGRRRADHVAEDQGIVALVELLPTRRVTEGDSLCNGKQEN